MIKSFLYGEYQPIKDVVALFISGEKGRNIKVSPIFSNLAKKRNDDSSCIRYFLIISSTHFLVKLITGKLALIVRLFDIEFVFIKIVMND